jgi:hypothetical protein
MLKLTYTDVGLYLERLNISLETLVAQRVILAMRLGQTLHVEPGKAAFLLPMNTPGLAKLEDMIRLERVQDVVIVAVDEDCVEVSIRGNWVAQDVAAHEGTFLAMLGDRAELWVYKLWQVTHAAPSFLA